MTRLVLLAAIFAWTASQSTAPQEGVIRWQPTGGPRGGEADQIFVRGDRILVKGDSGAWQSVDRGRTWRRLRGRFETGSTILESPTDLFVYEEGKLYRTPDHGATWVPCKPIPHPPGNRGELIPAADYLFVYVTDVGLFRSLDRCASWTPVRVPWNVDLRPHQFVVSQRSLLAMTNHGSFRTADRGNTWETLPKPPAHPLTSFVDSAGVVLRGTTNGVYRSTNDGLSWMHLGPAGRSVGRVIARQSGEIYASIWSERNQPVRAMLRSADNGATWTSAADGLTGHYIGGLARDSSGSLYAASVMGIYRSDGADGWRHLGPATLLVSSLLAAPWGDVYAASAARDAYRTTNRAAMWRPLPLPEDGSVAHAFGVTTSGDLLIGWSDWVYRSTDRGETWRQSGLNHRVTAVFTVPGTPTVLAGTTNGLFRSLDEGHTWIERSVGLDSFEVLSFAASDDEVLFVGTSAGEGSGEVYRSTDNGDRWRLLAPEFPGGPVNALVSLSGGGVIAGTTDGMFRWRPGRSDWERLATASRRLRVTSLVSDDHGRLVAGTTTGVFVSENGGDTWTAANSGLSSLRVRAITMTATGDIYLAVGSDGANGRPATSAGAAGVFRGRFVDR